MKKTNFLIPITLSILIFISLTFYGGIIYGKLIAAENEKPLQPSQDILNLENSFKAVSEHVSPSVVYINSEKVVTRNYQFWGPDEDFFKGTPFEEFFNFQVPGGQREQKVTGLGSGVIVSPDGYILTNSHVINGADEINITLQDGTIYNNVKISGEDTSGDIAVLKIEGVKDLPYATLGNSDELQVGSWVVAIGNPYGFKSTVTAGIVSAMGRDFSMGSPYGDFSNLIQTDAAINPGNSGGALVNLYGEVIGINTAIITPTGGSVGLGFAIPINNARQIMDEILEHGKVVHGWLGVGLQQITPELAEKFGVEYGVIINQVFPGGPAEKGGIEPGDVVIEIDNQEIKEVSALQRLISGKDPGDSVNITVVRNKEQIKLNVTVEARPEDGNSASATDNAPGEENNPAVEKWKGITVTGLTQEIREKYKISDEYGVIISEVEKGSRAEKAGLRGGEIIKKINDFAIKDISDYHKAVKKAGEDRETVMLVNYGNYSMFLIF